MAEFMIRFFLCNIFISILIVILLFAKHLLKQKLTSRTHYNLWFLLLGLLAIPFLPIPPIRFPQIFPWLKNLGNTSSASLGTALEEAASGQPAAAAWMNDFGISVSRNTPPAVGLILGALWGLGMLVMSALLIRSMLRFHILKKSALPLQNPAIQKLYHHCLKEMQLARPIPIYSTAFLKSPVIAGLFSPRIYLPIPLLSEVPKTGIRYILLHELCHYRSRDAFANCLMNLAGILYWFNPLVWYALREMKNDREIACDTSVLKLLDEDAYMDYGTTLINVAARVSLTPFPFAAGISGSMKQMQKRVINIANYHPASFRKNLHSTLAALLIVLILLGFAPILTIQAVDRDHYCFQEAGKTITYIDLSDTFAAYDGSFVLYDTTQNTWQIYNPHLAATRIPPASTYKIYDALFSLEAGIITPEESWIPWDGQHYAYDSWNTGQSLETAMQNSVTWYFQALDQKSSLSSIRDSLEKIGYGNQVVEGSLSSYWTDGALKISPLEQVEMLERFYYNKLDFSPENVSAVKEALRLSSRAGGTLSGKTGTEAVNGRNTSGWFIGYIEMGGDTCFFATNIQNESLASGPLAAELTFSILSELGLWPSD